MQRPLNQLPPGTRFQQPDRDITGTLLMVNECRALVRIDQPQQEVEITARDGSIRTFRASRNHETSWAPTVLVEALSFEPLPKRDPTILLSRDLCSRCANFMRLGRGFSRWLGGQASAP